MTTRIYEMSKHAGAGLFNRYYCDGVRTTKQEYRNLMDEAHNNGRAFNMYTKAKQLSGGRIRRTEYTTIEVPA